MAHQSESTYLQTIFEPALRSYEKKAGVSLTQHPLAIKLQTCESVEAITGILQDQAQAFRNLQGSDKIMESINIIVSILSKISFTVSLADAFRLTFPPARAIQACLAILLDLAKGIISNCDALVDLLQSIEHFLNRLNIYTRTPPTPPMDEMVVKILVELISTLALVTAELKQRRSIKFVKKYFKEKDIEAVLERLDRLTQDEARITAAHTLAIIHGLVQNMREFMDDGKASIDGVREDLRILHQMASDMNKSKRDKLLRNIRSWLCPPDPWKNYNIGRRSRHSETGTWFLNSNTLSEWKSSGPSSLLWIHGKPGAGKSVLCSTIIEDIEAIQMSGLASLAMFYYDFREDEKKDLRGLLSSMLLQLCDQSDSYYTIVSTFYSIHRDGARSPSDDELIRCLKDLLDLPGQAPIYLIIDALDECPNTSLPPHRDQVLMFLENLVDSNLPNLRICVTSRPETDIKPILEPLTFRSISLHNESGQKEDIENYIKSIVNTDRRMRRWTSAHKQLVISVLTERADGMFRWVHCQLDYLAGCLPGRIRHALDELPSTLDGTYERTLGEIKETNWEFARRLLLCIAIVSRPLRVEELAEFLAFDFEAGQIPTFHEDWRLEDPIEAVLSTCSTLLSLVSAQDSQVVQFSHFSVKEFLTSSRFAEKRNTISSRFHVSMTAAHALVARACLGILLHLDEGVTRSTLPKFPLAEYAAEHWFEHARFEGVSQEGMSQMFDQRKLHLAVWLWIYDPTILFWGENKQENAPLTPHGTPLHYAGFCGLYEVVKVLVAERLHDVNSRSFISEGTPLHLISRMGHKNLARLLIEHDADVAAKSKDGTTPLHEASKGGHIDLARLLIEHGANIAAQSKDGRTPLYLASEDGHVKVVRLLIEHGADAAAQSEDGLTPLHLASIQGYVELAQLLIKHGADAGAQSKYGMAPLHFASFSFRGHVDMARLLIEHGADVAAQSTDGMTPLHRASEMGRVDVVRLLIDHGADVAAQRDDGTTPLYLASERGEVDVVQLLIEHGADVAAQSKDGMTPLHQTSFGGRVDVAQLLIKHGADVAAQSKDGTTPLHTASELGRVDLARFLIDHGANAAAQSKDGTTPLHPASLRGHVDLVRLFIEHGADAAAQDKDGITPLHQASTGVFGDVSIESVADAAAKSRHKTSPLDWTFEMSLVDVARLLIEHGADASAQSNDGKTPLHQASFGGRVDIARFLIEHGVDVAAQDENGITPLHWGFFSGNVDVARLLIEHGADPSAQSKNGLTPLYWMSLGGHVDVARLLLRHGADAAAQSEDGVTPLHAASLSGHVDMAQFLLQHGANVAAQGEGASSPLHQASIRGHVDVARLLIEHGANVAAQGKRGMTPLHGASERGHLDLAQLLIVHGADVAAKSKDRTTPLHQAAVGGHVDVARLLIEHRANVAAQGKHGATPLHVASEQGHVDLARLLIEHGANVAAQNKDGTTSLHRASVEGHIDVVQLLIEHGADVAAQGKRRTTPLRGASEQGHLDVARLLIQHGADVAAQNKDGTTPLHRASVGGHVDVAQLLIEHGADVAVQGKHGMTPLHGAAKQGHLDLARLLIEHGANVTAQGKHGTTSLHLASKQGHVDLARLLIAHGADVAAQSKDGTSPLPRASVGGHVDVAPLLIEYVASVAAPMPLTLYPNQMNTLNELD